MGVDYSANFGIGYEILSDDLDFDDFLEGLPFRVGRALLL